MLITREWLDEVSDEQGLTKGQQELLKIHLGDPPYVGRELGNYIAFFIGECKGYRGMPKDVKGLLNRDVA